ncbi:ribosomal protein L22 [Tieghemostelium lacteum]|uniref:Ribosomal protein L22 n=1 Tax=Tieghemostelium lacteum TaxID=361077 RepID=A0A152A8E1_TIELA|nr:ribosomal protein L22 [Tieghemostelium lacteum]|eukprot:KYR02482.1 ribosomal protein L22 [Tieghemostelium lacteum]
MNNVFRNIKQVNSIYKVQNVNLYKNIQSMSFGNSLNKNIILSQKNNNSIDNRQNIYSNSNNSLGQLYYSTQTIPNTLKQSSTSSNIFAQSVEDLNKQTDSTIKSPKKQNATTKGGEKTVRVKLSNLGYSEYKLTALFRAITGLSYKEAIAQLTFCKLGPARKIKGLVTQARYVAEYQYDMNPDRLVVEQIWTGRSYYRKSVNYRARGSASVQRKPFCHITVQLREVPPVENEKKLGKFGKTHKTHAKYDGTFVYNKQY